MAKLSHLPHKRGFTNNVDTFSSNPSNFEGLKIDSETTINPPQIATLQKLLQNGSLKKLKFDFRADTIEILMQLQSSIQFLKELSITDVKIDDRGVVKLNHVLENNESITNLELQACSLTNAELKLLTSLKTTQITTLNLDNNKLTHDCAQSILILKKAMPNITISIINNRTLNQREYDSAMSLGLQDKHLSAAEVMAEKLQELKSKSLVVADFVKTISRCESDAELIHKVSSLLAMGQLYAESGDVSAEPLNVYRDAHIAKLGSRQLVTNLKKYADSQMSEYRALIGKIPINFRTRDKISLASGKLTQGSKKIDDEFLGFEARVLNDALNGVYDIVGAERILKQKLDLSESGMQIDGIVVKKSIMVESLKSQLINLPGLFCAEGADGAGKKHVFSEVKDSRLGDNNNLPLLSSHMEAYEKLSQKEREQTIGELLNKKPQSVGEKTERHLQLCALYKLINLPEKSIEHSIQAFAVQQGILDSTALKATEQKICFSQSIPIGVDNICEGIAIRACIHSLA